MRRFHPIDRETALLLPLSVQDWLAKGHRPLTAACIPALGITPVFKQYGHHPRSS